MDIIKANRNGWLYHSNFIHKLWKKNTDPILPKALTPYLKSH
jgi:hypothetical protein